MKTIYRVSTNVPSNRGFDREDIKLFDDLEQAKEYFRELVISPTTFSDDDFSIEESIFVEIEELNTGKIIETFYFILGGDDK